MSETLINITPMPLIRKYKYYCDYCHRPIKNNKPYIRNDRGPTWHTFCNKKHANEKIW